MVKKNSLLVLSIPHFNSDHLIPYPWYILFFPSSNHPSPSSNHYIHLSIAFPILNNVTHTNTNVRTHTPKHHAWSAPFSSSTMGIPIIVIYGQRKFWLKGLKKTKNAFHYPRVCEGVVTTPLTKESIFPWIPKGIWIILQSHSLVFYSVVPDQNPPTPRQMGLFKLQQASPNKTSPQCASRTPWLGHFSPSLHLLMPLLTTQNQPQNTLLSQRPRIAQKSGPAIVTRGAMPSAGHFYKTASQPTLGNVPPFQSYWKNLKVWYGNKWFLLY